MGNGWKTLAVAVAAALFAPLPVQAEWIKAETDRFVVYGEAREAKVREFVLKLSAYDGMLRLFHPSTKGHVPETKVQVILVRTVSDLRRIRPGMPSEVAGFYRATDEGVFAVAMTNTGLGSDAVLFHEYAHHFMMENFPVAYPAWFVEGFAEYFMTAEVTAEGVNVGGYNEARATGIFAMNWLPWDELLSKTTFETRRDQRNAFYAQSWLLTHYMRSADDRAAQLNNTINAISAGKEPAKAFWEATGLTAGQLTRVLQGYRKLIRIQATPPPPPAVTVTTLPASADDLLFDHMRLLMGSAGTDPAFVAAVRKRAAKFPGDPFAEMTLARAEFALGDVAAGETIMQRLRAAQPQDPEVLLLAGTGKILAGIRDSARRQEYFRAARPLVAKAYSLNKTDFRALYAYALCRSVEPDYPTDNDLNALFEARALAPAVGEISLRAGLALLQRGKREDARKVLAPVINNPHGGTMAAYAKALIDGKKREDAESIGRAAEADEEPAAPPAPGQP